MTALPDFDISQLDIARQLIDIDAWECEQDLMTFMERAWSHFDPADFTSNWLLEACAEHLEAVADVTPTGKGVRRLITNVPPRTGKTSLFSIVFPAWVWAQREKGPNRGPHVKFLYVSYNESLSREHSIACRRLVKSEWYQERWPHVKITDDVDNLSKFETTAGGSRTISSIGSRVTGKGADCFVAGTHVSTPSGSMKIEDILPGTEVYGVDTSRGKVLKTRVLAVRRVPARDLHEVHISGGITAVCSGDHPFFNAENGYVSAASMGRGDRVWVAGAQQGQGQNPTAPQMRLVPRSAFQATLRGAQGVKEKLRGLVLRTRMSRQASRRQKHQQALCPLHHENGAQKQPVLLNGMCASRARHEDGSASAERVQILREGVCGKPHSPQVLQRVVSESQPLAEYPRREKSALRARGASALRGVLRRTASSYRRTGRGVVRGVRLGSTQTETIKRQIGDASTCSSHRRETGEQLPGKPSGSVRLLPSDCPSIEQATVLSVEKYSGREDWMYDIQVEGTHNFFAEGVLVHNCIIIDDPNATNDISEGKLKEVTDYFDNTLRSRLNNKITGAILVVQQRTAENDLTGHILEHYPSEYDHVMIPMLYEPDRSFETSIGWKDPRTELGEPLWPERFNQVFIEAEKKSKYVWAGQYQQRPEVAGGGIVKREWWQLWTETSFPPMDMVIASLDTAYTVKKENDPSAMTVWGVFTTDPIAMSGRVIGPDGRPEYFDRPYNETAPKVMLMYAWAEHLEFFDLIKKVEKTCKALKVDRLIIENKAAGISLAQELRRLFGTADFGIQLEDPKSMDKMARLFSIQHLFEEGIIYAPDKVWADQVITQVGAFPKAKHDDLCFVAGTKIATSRGSVPIEQVVPGDQVVTPFGLRAVVSAGKTSQVAPVVTRGKLTGTKAHPVFVVDTGWQALDTVTAADTLLELNLCDLIRATHPKQSSLMGLSTDGWAVNENTTYRKAELTQDENAPRGYTLLFGSTTTSVRFLQGMKFITLMVTRSIAALRILSVYQLACIAECLKTSILKKFARIWRRFALSRPLGINPKKAVRGIVKSHLKVLSKLVPHTRLSHLNPALRAFGAEPRFITKTPDENFVRKRAATPILATSENTSKPFIPILQPVYNLTVEGAHCYYANGVLVHNCDTTSQAIRHLRDIGLLTRSRERLEAIESMTTYPGGQNVPLYPA